MLKVIALGGEPATGKTTLIFKLIAMADDWKVCKPEKLLDAMYSEKLKTYILGKYENDGNVFQGTDRLSMAVQPDAVKFINKVKLDDASVIFEGDRLFNGKFLEHIADNIPEENYKILVLRASHDEKEKRHVDRKDDQDDKFKNSRETKISNICSSLVLMGYIETMVNETYDDQSKIINTIKDFFTWSE
jgi:hypothetical protein